MFFPIFPSFLSQVLAQHQGKDMTRQRVERPNLCLSTLNNLSGYMVQTYQENQVGTTLHSYNLS